MFGKFVRSDKGNPITYYQKRICVPIGFPQPEIGEIWEFISLGENSSGNILNIKCVKLLPENILKKNKNYYDK